MAPIPASDASAPTADRRAGAALSETEAMRYDERADPDRPTYLDHAATSPLRDEVWAAMEEVAREADFNASSLHRAGQAAHARLEEARREIAGHLGCPRSELVITGGGTQSDNLAVLGFARAHADRDPAILVSAVEHRAVLAAAERAASEGARVERIPVDRSGTVDLDVLADLLGEVDGRPTLVSLMWANNEVGVVQPVAEAARLAAGHGAAFHTDAVQALGKVPVSLDDLPPILLTATAHKLGGPVGVGLLRVPADEELTPLAFGGTQERGLWPGTANPVGATGFAAATRLACEEREQNARRWLRLRDGLVDELRERIPDLRIHGGEAPRRLSHLLSVGVPGVDTGSLLVSLDLEGIAVSAGSACSSGSSSPSHVLEAMGITVDPAEYGVLRFSFGPETGDDEVARVAERVPAVVDRLRASTAAGSRR